MSEIDIENYDDEIEVVLSETVSFIELIDTPTTYTGQAGKLLQVKSDESGVEFTDAPTVVDWDEIGGDQTDISLSGFTNDLSTTDIPEGDNLYYTDARVRAAVSSSDPVTYNSETGDFGLAYNSTNLQISSTELNTIQDINTTATPQFTGVKVDKIQAITDSASAITIEDTTGTDIVTIDTVTPATNVYANLNIYGDITQNGSAYETHAEQIYTKDDLIITRDEAIAGLDVGEYSGIQAHLYDGVNDGQLVFDKDGWARVGDIGDLQKLATIEETPTGNAVVYWDNADLQLKTLDTVNTTELGYLANATGTTGTNKLVLDTNPTIVSPTINTSLTTNYLNSGSVLFAGTTKNITQDNSNLFWDNTNKRLGIGTSSPAGQLHVVGDIISSGDLKVDDIWNNNSTMRIGTTQGYSLEFYQDNIKRFIVNGYRFHPNVDNNVDSLLGLSDKRWYKLNIGSGGIVSDGNVGIGTTSPDSLLHINSSTNAIFTLQSTQTANSELNITAGANNIDYKTIGINDVMSFSTYYGEKMRITPEGNVGIGTTSPTGQLHVYNNVADATTTLTVNKNNASSTGDILKAQFGGTDKFTIGYDGTTTLTNNAWLRALDYAGTGVVNMFKVNASNEIDVGGTLNIGTLSLSEDSGLTSMINLPVSSTPTDGTEEAYTFNIDSDVVLKVHALANGSGGVDTKAVIIATEDLEVPNTSLSNGQTTFYLDETSNTLTVKCKYSNGTVKTGTIALS